MNDRDLEQLDQKLRDAKKAWIDSLPTLTAARETSERLRVEYAKAQSALNRELQRQLGGG